MGVVHYKLPVNRMICDNYVRLDSKYRIFSDVRQFVVWDNCDNIALGRILRPMESPKKKKGELDEEYKLIELQNIERCGNSLIDVETVAEIGSDKVILQNGDIIIPKMEPQKGQFFLNEQHQQFLGSSELIEYKINKDLYNPLFLYYVLVNPNVLKCLSFLESGKAHQRVSSDDLLKITIPKVPLPLQKKVVEQIKQIEILISELKASKTPHYDIINEVFEQEFGFDWKEFERLKKHKIYSINLINSANNCDCRLGCRFHHPAAKYVMDFMLKHTDKRIKDFCSEPICLGASISPNQFDENGDCYYISMATIKNYYFESFDAKTVSSGYEKENVSKKVVKDDIIVTRSGVAIGKFAIINDVNGIFADFTMRIRLNKELMIPLFAYYFFRSFFCQTMIHSNKKGLQNQNIFPSQIQEFPIPDFSLDKQQEIVSKIENRINTQKDIDRQIAEKRKEISRLIEDVIKQG